MRLFIAIDLSEQQVKKIRTLQERLKSYLDGVKWVAPRNLHLTLKFLGEVDPDKINQLRTIMDKTAGKIEPFNIRFAGCGVFPSPAKARVLWIGVREGFQELQGVASSLEKGLVNFGSAPDKKDYKPHLTLGRLRYPLQENKIRKFLDEEKSFTTEGVRIREMILYESRLLEQGALYSRIYKASFDN